MFKQNKNKKGLVGIKLVMSELAAHTKQTGPAEKAMNCALGNIINTFVISVAKLDS